MPDWTPEWADVRFDHAAAEAAAAACERAARLVEEGGALRARSVHATLLDAEGPAVQHLRRAGTAATAEERHTAAALRGAADLLRRASATAAADQRARVAERERWHREDDAERLLAAGAAPGPPG